MQMKIIKAEALFHGICCSSCQEDVNVHRCKKCGDGFAAGDIIFCKSHGIYDSEHYHDKCKPQDIEIETKEKED